MNYLVNLPGIEIDNINDFRDRVIDFVNHNNGATAFLVLNKYDDFVDFDSAQIICRRLGVPMPPEE